MQCTFKVILHNLHWCIFLGLHFNQFKRPFCPVVIIRQAFWNRLVDTRPDWWTVPQAILGKYLYMFKIFKIVKIFWNIPAGLLSGGASSYFGQMHAKPNQLAFYCNVFTHASKTFDLICKTMSCYSLLAYIDGVDPLAFLGNYLWNVHFLSKLVWIASHINISSIQIDLQYPQLTASQHALNVDKSVVLHISLNLAQLSPACMPGCLCRKRT